MSFFANRLARMRFHEDDVRAFDGDPQLDPK